MRMNWRRDIPVHPARSNQELITLLPHSLLNQGSWL